MNGHELFVPSFRTDEQFAKIHIASRLFSVPEFMLERIL
jgi:hypothetical protein